MADESKEKQIFNAKGHSVKTVKESFNGYTIDALFTETEGKIEAFINIEGEDMQAQHYKEFKGNGSSAHEKALSYYNEVKSLYSKK
jgi:hypothetical protein